VRIFVTGGTGALGRAFTPLAKAHGHQVVAPSRADLDLFDAAAIGPAVQDVDAVLHLASRIQPLDQLGQPGAWAENDLLRAVATAVLVDAALAAATETYVQPTVAFVYPAGRPASEDTPVGDVPAVLRSALVAERQAARFAAAGRRGVVLRLGLLDGPGTGHDRPSRRFGATLNAEDAGRALLAALTVPSGTYNVCRDGELVSNQRFVAVSGWHAMR
jgi:nucleoside-diphosphate-sugar epimerase